jgi:hypothetical protein
LFVDVVGSPLEGDRRREQNDRAQSDQRVHEDFCAFGRQVFRDLQGDHQIELPIEPEQSSQVKGPEAALGDLQHRGIDVCGVDTQDIGDAMVAEN